MSTSRLHHPHFVHNTSPRDELLGLLAAQRISPLVSLARLAAFYEGNGGVRDLRHGFVKSAPDRVFPHPADVPVLLVAFLSQLAALWQASRCIDDDLLIAAFCFHALTSIHPFSNANGRVAVDFAELCLRLRWDTARPWRIPEQCHQIFGGAIVPMDPPFAGGDDAAFHGLRQRLLQRFSDAELNALRATPSYCAIAQWLRPAVTVSENPGATQCLPSDP